MDRLGTLAIFAEVAEAGSFTAAAAKLGVSTPAASRAVAQLEARIGARLLIRTTRSVRTTEAGARLAADARRILADLDAAEAAAAGAHGRVAGTLRITAPVLFGRLRVAPVAAEFLDAHPDARVELALLDRPVDIVMEGHDIAVRIGTPPDSSLRMIRAGAQRLVTCAAPALIAARGAPARPEDLADWPVAGGSIFDAPGLWRFERGSDAVTVRMEAPRLATGDIAASIATALAGRGVLRALAYQVAEAVAGGELTPLLEGFETREIPVSLLHPAGARAPGLVRAFLDFAAPRLSAER